MVLLHSVTSLRVSPPLTFLILLVSGSPLDDNVPSLAPEVNIFWESPSLPEWVPLKDGFARYVEHFSLSNRFEDDGSFRQHSRTVGGIVAAERVGEGQDPSNEFFPGGATTSAQNYRC